jgi:hypothetical protein
MQSVIESRLVLHHVTRMDHSKRGAVLSVPMASQNSMAWSYCTSFGNQGVKSIAGLTRETRHAIKHVAPEFK